MTETNKDFKEAVYEVVAQIPRGKVMSYGQIAALCGSPRAARIVGQVAHFGPHNLPWQRVVKQDGQLAEGFPGGTIGHAAALEAEGVELSNYRVPMNKYVWWPDE